MPHDVVVQRDVRIPAGEVTLSGDLFRPDVREPVPLLLMALPYRRDMIAMNGGLVERWFAARGYAMLLIDLRGTGSSDGRPRPAFDPGEADDAIAAIDWAIAQPWCDGNVGMWGHSYGAMTTMRTASRRPAGLKAIIAWQGTDDPGHEFVHPGGVRGALGPLGLWGVGSLLNQLLPPLDDAGDPAELARWGRRMASEPVVLDFLRHGPSADWWQGRRIDAGSIELPALCLAGWRDLFADGMVRSFERMRGPKRLIAGPWMHSSPQDSPWAPIDFANLALAWWDRWLRGVADGAFDGPAMTAYVQGGDRPRWLAMDGWPSMRSLELGAWEVDAPGEPDARVGPRAGLWAFPFGAFGLPLDQHDDDVRSFCLTSPPLERPMLVAGRPVVTVEHDWPQVSMRLTDVDAMGRSTLICAGLGGAGQREIALAATCYEIRAGHRLRLAAAPADFPRVWPVAAGPQWPIVRALSLPAADPDWHALETPMPAPDPALFSELLDLAAELTAGLEPPGRPVWEMSENPATATVSVRLGVDGTVTSRPPHRKHLVRSAQRVTATACGTDPGAAAITGQLTTTVDTDTGRHIDVDIAFTFKPEQAHISARVNADGEDLLEKSWEYPL